MVVYDFPSCVPTRWCLLETKLTSGGVQIRWILTYLCFILGGGVKVPSEHSPAINQREFFWGPRTSQGIHPLRVLSSWCTLPCSWGVPRPGSVRVQPLGILLVLPKCYGESIRDDHSQFIAIWKSLFQPNVTTLRYLVTQCNPKHLDQELLKAKKHILVSCSAVVREVLKNQTV